MIKVWHTVFFFFYLIDWWYLKRYGPMRMCERDSFFEDGKIKTQNDDIQIHDNCVGI